MDSWIELEGEWRIEGDCASKAGSSLIEGVEGGSMEKSVTDIPKNSIVSQYSRRWEDTLMAYRPD